MRFQRKDIHPYNTPILIKEYQHRTAALIGSAGVAVFSIARKLAKLVYRMLRWGVEFISEGMQAYEQRFEHARIRSCRSLAKSLGYKMLPLSLEASGE